MKELTYQEVILRPIVTEKTIAQAERYNTYAFVVRESSNKIQIRTAIEKLFGVGVEDVRTQRYMGKRRRMGRHIGSTSSWKKALVKVKEGDTIDFY